MVTVNENCLKQNLASRNPRISQTMLANKLGVSQRSISKYETAVLLPPPYVLVAMAKCFGITIDELLSETLPDKKGMKENE